MYLCFSSADERRWMPSMQPGHQVGRAFRIWKLHILLSYNIVCQIFIEFVSHHGSPHSAPSPRSHAVWLYTLSLSAPNTIWIATGIVFNCLKRRYSRWSADWPQWNYVCKCFGASVLLVCARVRIYEMAMCAAWPTCSPFVPTTNTQRLFVIHETEHELVYIILKMIWLAPCGAAQRHVNCIHRLS